jgi:hypothetical protein
MQVATSAAYLDAVAEARAEGAHWSYCTCVRVPVRSTVIALADDGVQY